jgi:hypothetical protein
VSVVGLPEIPSTYDRAHVGEIIAGPAGTLEISEAARFDSEHAAMQSPAFTFPLTFYKPELVDDDDDQAAA